MARAGSGHLGSNLGAVELTLALHRVFDSPRDILLWDTGHQAYVHKIVTGRAAGLRPPSARPAGCPATRRRDESEHDWIENSHASTVISYAHGLAVAQEHEGGEGRRVVAVIGDGSLTGGMAFEGLNNLGHSGKKAILDPERQRPLVRAHRLQARREPRPPPGEPQLPAQPGPPRQLLHELPVVGHQLERSLDGFVAAVREMFEPPAFFETLGVRYTGPFDGHDIEGMEKALRNAAEFDGPIVVHVVTQKGRGYAPAENDPIKRLHDIGQPQPGTYTAAFTEAMIKEAEARPELVAITAAMPDSTGLLPFGERFPGRLIDVGIAEQHAVTSAAGMAMGGLRPVVAVYSTFLTRAIDQVTYDVGLHGQPVVFCLDRAGITGDDGASHHGVLDMALLTKVPGHDAVRAVVVPGARRDAPRRARPLRPARPPSAGRRRRPRRSIRTRSAPACGAARSAPGATSASSPSARCSPPPSEAADALAAEGIEATVWDVRVVPLDPEMLADAAEHPVVLTAEDGIRDGGVGSLIADAISRVDTAGPSPRSGCSAPRRLHPPRQARRHPRRARPRRPGLAAEARALVAALRA